MNLNETLNSDFKKNELLDDEYSIDEEQLIREQEEESKYGKSSFAFYNFIGGNKSKTKTVAKKSNIDADTIRDEDTMVQEDSQGLIDIRVEQLQSKMRSKDDMFRVLHDYRKPAVL